MVVANSLKADHQNYPGDKKNRNDERTPAAVTSNYFSSK